ncbi:MAG: hypothetical protein OXC00_09345, partial [Acidimicrobiaceae bacterium]|nr:hypothetical protein [Acidimicrobiaceae bacterium]
MCGIIAIVRRPSTRPVPDAADVIGMVEAAAAALATGAVAAGTDLGGLAAELQHAAGRSHAANELVGGVPGVRLLLESPAVADTLAGLVDAATASVAALEARLDADTSLDPAELEHLNEQLVRVRDGLWALGRDRLGGSHPGAKVLPAGRVAPGSAV